MKNILVTFILWIGYVQGGANKKDGFSSFYGSPVLSETVTKIVNQ